MAVTILEGDVTECSVKGLQKWPNMAWGSHFLKTTTLVGCDLEKSHANTNSEIMILVLLYHVSGIKKWWTWIRHPKVLSGMNVRDLKRWQATNTQARCLRYIARLINFNSIVARITHSGLEGGGGPSVMEQWLVGVYKHYFECVECKEDNLTVRSTLCTLPRT